MRGVPLKATTVLAVVLAIVPVAAALPPDIRLPDGITALVASVGALTDEVVARDADGNFAFDIAVFEKSGDAWAQAPRIATLRIAVYDLEGEHDVFSKPTQTKADGTVRVVAPGSLAQTGQPMDVWVTIYKVTSYPTSHLSIQKNALIGAGQYDLADAFDYHHVVNPVAG